MTDRENAIRMLRIERECVSRDCDRDCAKCDLAQDRELLLKAYDDALELLKAQEQEISRLKHHVDCDAAEKLPSGCVGYGRWINDDEPCETCKACEKYNGYGEE